MRKTTILSCTFALLVPAVAAAQIEGEAEGEVGVGVEGDATAVPEETTEPATTETTATTMTAAGGIAGAGDFGVGGDATLAGGGGVHFTYQMSDQLGLQGILGLRMVTADGYDDTVALGVQAFYRMNTTDNGTMGLFGGVDFSDGVVIVPGTMPVAVDATQIGLAGGVYGEWFLDPAFSIQAQAGLAFVYISGENDTSGTALGLGGDAVARLGFTYWFR